MKRISTAGVFAGGLAAFLGLGFAILALDPAARAEAQEPPAAAGTALESFVPVDTARLMGSPDEQPTLGVERAFPHLTFTRPVEFTHAGDGTDRVFVVEQDGRVRVFPNRTDAKETKVFLDLRGVVRREHNEEGLLGLAFHPSYRTNG